GGDPAQRDPAHARRARCARAREPRRRAADLRADADDARPELQAAVHRPIEQLLHLYGPRERTAPRRRGAVSRHALGTAILAAPGVPAVKRVALAFSIRAGGTFVGSDACE